MAIKRKFDWGAINDKIKSQENKNNNYSNDDENSLYKIKVKEDGTAQAIIRFLPPKPDEDLPFVKIYNHGWQDVNGWVITNCPTTLGKPCPICKENSRIWDEDTRTARPRSRKLSYYANIMVVKDPQNPENEGKVFKYRYGVKIHEKIMEKLQPENPDIDEPVEIFDYVEGANFKLKVKTVKSMINGREVKFLNYDASSFSEPTHIINPETGDEMDDSDVERLENEMYPLSDIIKPTEFKSYQEIAELFNKKTGLNISTSPTGTVKQDVVSEDTSEPIAAKKQSTPEPEELNMSTATDDDDDEDDFFKKLAEED